MSLKHVALTALISAVTLAIIVRVPPVRTVVGI